MAGEGQRFRNVGVANTKPLIDVNGIPMFRESLKSLESIQKARVNYFFIIRQDFPDYHHLKQEILSFDKNATIVSLTDKTRGAAETVLHAKPYLDFESPLLILDCDIRFYSKYFLELLQNPNQQFCDGALLSFKSRETRFSYLISKNNIVTKTAEKKKISDDAIIGAYFFRKSQFFFEASEKLMTTEISEILPEYFISSVYNILIEDNRKIIKIDGMMDCFGTPQELEIYLASLKS